MKSVPSHPEPEEGWLQGPFVGVAEDARRARELTTPTTTDEHNNGNSHGKTRPVAFQRHLKTSKR